MERIELIRPSDGAAMERARSKWNAVAKPLHSLGLLEDAVVRIAGMTGTENVELKRRRVIVMCADNGVVSEGVTQTGSDVTAIVARAMAKGRSSVNILADCYGADVLPVDIGMLTAAEGVLDRKIIRGTGNIAVGQAMTSWQAEAAVSVGIDLVRDSKNGGCDIIVTGEMGIGNTTTASALAAVLLSLPAEAVTGRGAGLSETAYKRKIEAINRAVEVNKPDVARPIEMLAKLGGLDIAGMTGLFLGGAIYRVPIVIDGFISAVAAALAAEIAPKTKDFMLCSHVSNEPAGAKILNHLGMKPLITAGMFLGEGTGGAMLLPLLDGALAVYNSAHHFDELPMERYVEFKKP